MDKLAKERQQVFEWLMYHGYWLAASEIYPDYAPANVEDRHFTEQLEASFIELGHYVRSPLAYLW